MMQIFVTGLNHNTAPIAIRERASFTREQLPEALSRLVEKFDEGVILSTCNRTEIYTLTDSPGQASNYILRLISDFHGLDTNLLEGHSYNLEGADAARNLFRVSSGLDSMILGESQILGQVRTALSAAADARTVHSVMLQLFHTAIGTGRRVREETDVSRSSLSVSYAAVKLAESFLGSVSGLKVLLVGVGEAGTLVAQALRSSGVNDITIANRTPERSAEMAEELGGKTVPFSELEHALSQADICIAATDASEPILSRATVASAVDSRPEGSLFLFDLSVPRNIDPEAGNIDRVNLFNIDDLSDIASQNLRGRQVAAGDAEVIVEEEVAQFMSWLDTLEATPLIKAMRLQADEIRRRELDRALREIKGLSESDIAKLEAMTRSIVNRMLHGPTTTLRDRIGEDFLEAAREMFLRPSNTA
ncbi:MAG: glutamyl-tRNA reductase [SAR202 cluster bacterium]|nr:glutamyl-tRNA reductase [SAR202 cluster bacterium]